ncbi:MAG: divergent polysaccharide deacetylase family protein, partial [Desulfuromonadales bacterium]|nr:divergent polysaccharide deacetylase family protein [Desulfuromonadales bacterium]
MAPRKASRSRAKPAKKNGKKKSSYPSLKVVLAALFVLAFLLGSLVLLARVRESLQVTEAPRPAPPVAGVRPTEIEPVPLPPPTVPGSILEDIRVELESTLLRSGVSLSDLETRLPPDGPARYDIRGEFPPSGLLTDLDRRLARLDGELRLERLPQERELKLWWRGSLHYHLRFHPPSASAPVGPPSSRPLVAIVMDDLGRDLATARSLLAIDLPITFAILPGEPQATALAQLAHRHGREVLIHLPMEPQGYPAINPGDDALLTRMAAEEIRAKMAVYRQQVPHAVGGNNHMGSRFTENREGMQ